MFKKILLLSAIMLAAVLTGCSLYSSTPAPSTAPVKGNFVTISNFSFNPDVLEVSANDTVTWRNNDSVTHKIVSSNLFESGNLNQGNEFSFTFTTPGTYDYICSIHPSMKGKIIVK